MNTKVYKCCVVPLCKNTSLKTPEKLFIYVPHAKHVRKKWLEAVRRDPESLSFQSSLYICEDHFDLPKDMQNYMEYHIMGYVSQVRMKPGCVPTKFECQPNRKKRPSNTTRPETKRIKTKCKSELENTKILECMENEFIPEDDSDDPLKNNDPEEKSDKAEVKKRKELIDKLLKDANKTDIKKQTNTNTSSKEYLSTLVPIAPKVLNLNLLQKHRNVNAKLISLPSKIPDRKNEEKNTKMKKEINPEHTIKVLQHDNAIYKRRINEMLATEESLRQHIKYLENKIKNDSKDFIVRVKEVLSNVLTSNQIDMVLGKKSRAWWTDMEYAKAYTLQHISKKAYFYVKDTLNYPLPAFSTLQQWAAKLGTDLPEEDEEEIPPLPKQVQRIGNFKVINKDFSKENALSQDIGVNDDFSIANFKIEHGNDISGSEDTEGSDEQIDYLDVEIDNVEEENEIGIADDNNDLEDGNIDVEEHNIVLEERNDIENHNDVELNIYFEDISNDAEDQNNDVQYQNNHVTKHNNATDHNTRTDRNDIRKHNMVSEHDYQLNEHVGDTIEQIIVNTHKICVRTKPNESHYHIVEEDNG